MPEKQITCLRCKHAKLIPETNLKDPTPVIYCAKKNDKSPLILSGCGLANSQRYDKRSEKLNAWRGKGGDELKSAGEVEEAWLKVHYWDASWDRLISATQRTRATLITMARYRGWKRSGETIKYTPQHPKRAKQRIGMIFNELQSVYIIGCYTRDYWPTNSGNFHESGRQSNQAIRDEIVMEVNRLDENSKEWTWESIRRHVRWKSPSYQRDMAKSNRRKRERKKLKVLLENYERRTEAV